MGQVENNEAGRNITSVTFNPFWSGKNEGGGHFSCLSRDIGTKFSVAM